jgi:hypothetical protein
MMDIKTSLDTISHEYTVFEADQVLTHEQLNGVVDYLTDHDRLTRVDLIGVGIYCGLQAALRTDRVRLTRGVGVTTDGDIARIPSDIEYTRYKRYDDTAPRYGKLLVGNTPLKTWELLPATTTDPGAAALTAFEATEGVQLSSLSALILIESVDLDNDICSDTSCDSRGDRATETLRLLILDAAAAASIVGAPPTPAEASRTLDVIVIDRPLMTGVMNVGGLVVKYRIACNSVHAKLAAALPRLHVQAGSFLWDSDPTPAWLAQLTTLQTWFAASGLGIQYYYDYLKDVVETYSSLCEWLSGDTTVCVPDIGAFPKHLVLGRIVPGSGTDARTGFYPSSIVRAAVDRRGHARFLARKLGVLLSSWRLPTPGESPVRITPSLFEDRSLEDRAIPYYYDPRYVPEVHDNWSFELSRRGMGRYNLSYHAPGNWAPGDAARPLESNLGRFTFFRVEGQLGRDINDVVAILVRAIRDYNLPITIATGLLPAALPLAASGTTDLRNAYDAIRAQLTMEVERVRASAGVALTRLGLDIFAGYREVVMSVRAIEAKLQDKAAEAKAGLALSYDEAHVRTDWRTAIDDVIQYAAEFRLRLGTLLRIAEAMPFETLAKSAAPRHLDSLRDSIQDQELQATDPLFVSHLLQQPGLDHFAGALRGATLLLVHDEDDHVLADFMLPCCQCEVLGETGTNVGTREAISGMYAAQDATHNRPLQAGVELLADRFTDGVRLAPGVDIKLATATEADCSVMLELPFPTTASDIAAWGPDPLGFQRIVLDGTVAMQSEDLIWKPADRITKGLRRALSEALGPPPIDFINFDEPTPAWTYGARHQLIYQDADSKPLRHDQRVLGGAAVYRRPARSKEIYMRVHWSQALQVLSRFQTGLIYDFTDGTDFSMLLYEASLTPAGADNPSFRLTSEISVVVVHGGIARWGKSEPIQSREILGPLVKHPPTEIRVTPEGVRISSEPGTGFPETWNTTKLGADALDKRIGAFTTVPVEIWELSDGVQSLSSDARIRARLHFDRDAATWDGPPGGTQPFIPDYDTWFWLRGEPAKP